MASLLADNHPLEEEEAKRKTRQRRRDARDTISTGLIIYSLIRGQKGLAGDKRARRLFITL